jgi:membrane protease YdiL (CAAX protease family)
LEQVKVAAFFLAEFLAFTLLLKAIASLLFGLPVNSMTGQVSLWFVFGLLSLALAWLFSKLMRGWNLSQLGFRFHRSFAQDIWLGVCGFAISNLLSVPFDLAALRDRSAMAHGIVEQFHFTSAAQILLGGIALAAALGFFTGAFHEEIRFRGYYQGAGSGSLPPLACLLIGLIPFSLGHYYAQPDWSVAQVLATLIPGSIYGLLFLSTRSLTVVMTTHTLTNVLPFLPLLLHELTGRNSVTFFAIGTLAFLSLLLIVLRWNHELREWREPILSLFTEQPLFGAVAGLIIGGMLLALWPHEFRPLYAAIAGIALFAMAFAGHRFTSGHGFSR